MNIYKVKVQRWMMMLLLTMVSVGADAKVNVEIGTFTGGKITATQGEEKNGEVEITLTVTPDNGYTITKDDITVVATFAPQASRGNTRQKAPDLGSPLTLNGKDPADLSEKRDYTLTIDANLGVWVKEAKFKAKESGSKDGTEDFSGLYFIANNNDKDPLYNFNKPLTNYYMCPTEGYVMYKESNQYTSTEDTGMPFITTYQCYNHNDYDQTKALWKIQKIGTTNYYYIINKESGNERYLTFSGKINGITKTGRMRLHLEGIENIESLDPNSETAKKLQFTITLTNDGYYNISPRNSSSDYLNPAKGNYDNLTAEPGKNNTYFGKEGAPSGLSIYGIVGIYNVATDVGSKWYLEIPQPTISYSDFNKAAISCINTDATIYYTTDGSDPTNSSTRAPYTTGAITLSNNVNTIKAVASAYGMNSQVVTSYMPILGADYPYLVQSKDCEDFYMMQGETNANGYIKVNTSSLARPSMGWYFVNAGTNGKNQLYYIVNKSTGHYLYYDNVINVALKESSDFDADDNNFKFYLDQYMDNGTPAGFNIISFSHTITWGGSLCKGNASTQSNNTDNVIWLEGLSNNIPLARWNFIPIFDNKMPATTPPFDVSDDSESHFYKIGNVDATGFHIIPPTGTAGDDAYANTSDATSDNNNMAWLFKEAASDDWLTYYHIVNAVSGEYLYFGGNEEQADNDKAFITQALSETQGDRYQFVIAKTTDAGVYYIVPKPLRYKSQNSYCLLSRDDTNPIKTIVDRANNKSKWSFIPVDLFCTSPIFEETTDGNIKIKCNTNAAKIYINTENNNEPTIDNGNLYDPTNNTNQNWSKDVQIRIKAIAVVSDGTNSISSQVTTLLNKPNVTLDPSYTNYAYDGNPHEPGISEVSIGEGADITIAPTSPATYLAESTDYSNNINVSTDENKAKVTLRDKEGDDWYIMNASTTFSIVKADITPTITIADWTYGSYDATINAPVITGNTDNSTETVEYKLTSAEETAYTTNVPTDAGDYTIRVTIAETDNCNGNTASNTFTIIPKTLTDDNIIITKNDDNTYSVSVVDGTDDLTLTTDYTLGEPTGSASSKYYVVPVNGANNYTGSLIAKYANAAFSQRGGSSDPWVATFITNSSGDGDYAAPEGMTVCIARDITGNLVTTENLDYIPENVPVILLSNNEAKGFQVKGRNGGTDITDGQRTGNWLKVDDEIQENVPMASFYLLYGGEFLLNMPGNLPARAIYLQKAGSSGARLRISKSQATGIEDGQPSIFQSPPAEVWHTLDGRRLSGKPAMKGLYIMNGNKTAIK